MPGGMSGLEAASRMVALSTSTRILISPCTNHSAWRSMCAKLALTVSFKKSQAARDLILAVERLLAGGTFFGGEPNEQPGIKKADKPASAAKATPDSGFSFCSVFAFA